MYNERKVRRSRGERMVEYWRDDDDDGIIIAGRVRYTRVEKEPDGFSGRDGRIVNAR